MKFETLQTMSTQPQVVSFSVDCDDVDHYANFAPHGATVPRGGARYLRMCRTLARLFRKHGITATFFCIADRLEDEDTLSLFRELVSEGHRIANHSYSHPEFGFLTERKSIEEVRRAHHEITERLGVRPVGYRAPAYFQTPAVLEELMRLGYTYDSSVCESASFRAAVRLLSLIRPSFSPKKTPQRLGHCSGNAPSLMRFSANALMVQWPIPQALGLPFYGTLHALLPKPIFFAQWALARTMTRHLHYEIHPIEVIDSETASAFPWLPTARLVAAKRESWLDLRLATLVSRPVVTIEESSAIYLSALH